MKVQLNPRLEQYRHGSLPEHLIFFSRHEAQACGVRAASLTNGADPLASLTFFAGGSVDDMG
jgi:hypothetical protein